MQALKSLLALLAEPASSFGLLPQAATPSAATPSNASPRTYFFTDASLRRPTWATRRRGASHPQTIGAIPGRNVRVRGPRYLKVMGIEPPGFDQIPSVMGQSSR